MNYVLLCAILSVALAKPEGYYRQQYQYQSSSSAYKNNELQRKTDDEGFYAKHGDLEGRAEPKVNAYSHHTDYVNPNLQNGHADYSGGRYNQGLTEQELAQRAEGSFAQFGAGHSSNQYGSSGSSFGSSSYGTSGLGLGQARQTQAGEDLYGSSTGSRKQYSYSGSYSASSGSSGLSQIRGGDYDTQSNLVALTQQLQDDLSRQLQSAISRQHQSSSSQSHSSSSSSISSAVYDTQLRELEQELQANLTRQLQESLRRQYGAQGQRGTHTYTITSGTYNPTPNYNNQELTDLTAQLQDNLMRQLREKLRAQQTSYSESNTDLTYQRNQQQNKGYRPFASYDASSPTQTVVVDRTPVVVNPSVSLTSVIQSVQNDVDLEVNEALNQVEYKYLLSDAQSYERPDYEVILQNLKDQVRRNLTETLERALYRNYGGQYQQGSYYFTAGRTNVGGEQVANYRYDDLVNLKKQVEDNLVQKLTQVINDQKNRYVTKTQYSSATYEARENKYVGSRPQTGDDRVYTSHATFQPAQSQIGYHAQPETRPTVQTSYGYRPTTYDVTLNKTQSQVQTSQQAHVGGGSVYQPTYNYPSGSPTQPDTQQLEYGYNPTSNVRPSGSGPAQTIDSGTPVYTYTRPSSQSSGGDSSYRYVGGTRQSGVEYTGGNLRSDSDQQLQTIQQELQSDLSQQVQDLIRQQQATSYSSSSSSSSSSSQSAYASNQVVNELSEELKQNLTQKLEELLRQHFGRQGIRGGYSYTITTGGNLNSKANYNSQQIAELTAQLQEQLLRQLREGLTKQSYQYSASYRPVVAHGSYSSGTSSYGGGRYVSGSRQFGSSSSFGTSSHGATDGIVGGECCMQADDNFTKHVNEDASEEGRPLRGDVPQVFDDDDQQLVDLNQHAENIGQKTLEQEQQVVGLEVGPGNEDLTVPIKPNVYLAQQTEDDFGQQTEDGFGKLVLTHHNEDSSGLTQQTEDLTQQTEDLAQHTEDLTQQQQEDLSQGFIRQSHSDDQLIHTGDSHTLHQNPHYLQTEVGSEHNEELTQQTHDLAQQTIEEDLAQHTENLNYQSPYGIPGYHQQNLNGQISQQHVEDLSQRTEDQSQYTENLAQHTEDLSQQTEDLSQHTENLAQQTEDLTQQQLDLIRQSHTGSPSFSVNYESSGSSSQSSSSSADSQQSYSSSHAGTLHHGVPQHISLDTTGDLEQQQAELQRAHVVQDVSHQAQSPASHYSASSSSSRSSSSSSSSSSSHSSSFSSSGSGSAPSVVTLDQQQIPSHEVSANMEQVQNVVPTEEPGFWKRLGTKITDTYKSAKDKISEKIG